MILIAENLTNQANVQFSCITIISNFPQLSVYLVFYALPWPIQLLTFFNHLWTHLSEINCQIDLVKFHSSWQRWALPPLFGTVDGIFNWMRFRRTIVALLCDKRTVSFPFEWWNFKFLKSKVRQPRFKILITNVLCWELSNKLITLLGFRLGSMLINNFMVDVLT